MSMFSLRRPSPALVISAIALFVALGGTSYAAGELDHARAATGATSATSATAKSKKKPASENAQDTALIKKLAPTLSVKYAKTSGSAVTAGSATDAVNATNATNAVNATNATNATNALNAVNATNASQATTATTATTAMTATSAATATSATTATNATNAINATNVDGHTFTQINATGTPTATVLSNFGGMNLQCTSPGGTSGTVTLSIINNSSSSGTFSADVTASAAQSLQHGTVPAANGGVPTIATFTFPTTSAAQVNFSYALPSGGTTQIVTGTFGITLTASGACTAFGNAQAS
jgi:hypothetical protein